MWQSLQFLKGSYYLFVKSFFQLQVLLQVLDCNKETEIQISLRAEGLETNYMIMDIKCAEQAYIHV